MRNIQFRHLRYFVAVAEAGSVQAGARVVGIVQPALSRQIHELEEAIGTPLLRRTSKGVEVTAAGQSFLSDARRMLQGLAQSQDRALRASRGELGVLRVGALPNYLVLPALAGALQRFRAELPRVSLSVEPMLSVEQAAAIAQGQIDGGIMAWRQAEAPHLSHMLLLKERFVLAMPSSGTAPVRPPRKLADLAGTPFVWCDPIRSPAQHRFLTTQCQAAGFTPQVQQTGSDMATLMGLVAAGVGCTFVPSSMASTCPPSIRLVSLAEVGQRFPVEWVYDPDRVTPVMQRFMALLKAAVAEAGTAG
ncbi:LysR family transcriptional regulator [Ideonella sp. B508-1]|uniref:LysR family transcriptional regulator n=1 Tax=Ideonella sp. B508-1 TaxID=137716 RepID=UPI0003456A4E|nr:LysR family transcriptional regulator [Ideonella sp. B508-1]